MRYTYPNKDKTATVLNSSLVSSLVKSQSHKTFLMALSKLDHLRVTDQSFYECKTVLQRHKMIPKRFIGSDVVELI